MKNRMAKLIGYKRKDTNRYSTFSNASFETGNDSLKFKMSDNKKKISPAVHKKSERRPADKKSRRKRFSWKFLKNKWVRRFCCPCFFTFAVCCKRKKKKRRDNDDDIDRAVEEFKQTQNSGQCSQRSTLKSEKSAGGFWSWGESWKSNSDKFLESLELDCVGSDKSLKRKLRQQNSKVRVTAFGRFGGGSIVFA